MPIKPVQVFVEAIIIGLILTGVIVLDVETVGYSAAVVFNCDYLGLGFKFEIILAFKY